MLVNIFKCSLEIFSNTTAVGLKSLTQAAATDHKVMPGDRHSQSHRQSTDLILLIREENTHEGKQHDEMTSDFAQRTQKGKEEITI